MSDNHRLDIVIFGATGFTGKHTVKKAERLAKDMSFTWGIAGRRKEALQSVLQQFAPNSKNIKIIIADLEDEESLKKMCEQAKVIVNCCGPYRFYGEPVIKACIATKTHHVDVSGEPEYMERMQLEYNKAAEESEIYIVSACGVISIPCDLGIIFTQDKFGGDVNSVETYMTAWSTSHQSSGTLINSGTWKSMVHHLAHEYELRRIRDKLYPEKLPELRPLLKTKHCIHRNVASTGYSTLFPGADLSVALRTQRFMFDRYNQRPVQVQTYLTSRSLWQVISGIARAGFCSLLSNCGCGLSLLLKHPKFFSGGLISNESPNEEAIKKLHFSLTIVAKGWTERLNDPTEQHKEPPNKEMITRVSGVNPGYGTTCVTLLMSALMIVKESYRMPGSGGVLTPGAAFAKTSMIDELTKYNVKFEVLSFVIRDKNVGKV